MLEIAQTAAAANWLLADLRQSPRGIGSVMPRGFGAYARIFHPVARGVGATIPEVRWTEVVDRLGIRLDAVSQWAELTSPLQDLDADDLPVEWDGAPWTGSLPPRQAEAIANVATTAHVDSERIWFAVWRGWGSLKPTFHDALRLQLPGREMVLLHGQAADAARNLADEASIVHQSANLWWPDSHAWFVSTEVDEQSTYVGGSSELIAQLLGEPVLEAVYVSEEQATTAQYLRATR